MQEELDDEFVNLEVFGKREGLTHESSQALAQRVIEALEVIGGATLRVGGVVLGGWQDVVIALQVVGPDVPAQPPNTL